MTINELKNLLKSTGIPVAYHHFNSPQNRPFIVFALDGEDDLMADDQHYTEIKTGYIELYTDIKDFDAENLVKTLLNNPKLAFEKENDAYIESEKMFYVRWSFSLI
jgi:tRNA G10  N-methylase Trm11